MAKADLIFWAELAFLLGLAAATFPAIPVWIAAAALTVFHFSENRKVLAAALGGFFLLGLFYFRFAENLEAARRVLPRPEEPFRGIIRSIPQAGDRSQFFTIELEPPHRGTARVILPPGGGFRYGDELELKGRMRVSEGKLLLVFPEAKIGNRGKGHFLRQKLMDVRGNFVAAFERSFSRDAGSFLAGITFGAREDFSQHLRDRMAKSGTTHVVALSGYNVGILVLAAGGILGRILSRRAAFWGALGSVFLFTLMTGGEPSIVRAAIMGALGLAAGYAGRIYSFPHAVGAAAFLMALFDPAVLGDAGFQLSFLALLGVAYLLPVFRKGKAGEGSEHWWSTVSAQAAVAPVLVAKFGGISAVSLAANFILLPLIPATMAAGFGFIALNAVFPPAAQVVAWCLAPLAGLELKLIEIAGAASAPAPVSALGSWSAASVYYAALAMLVWRSRKNALRLA